MLLSYHKPPTRISGAESGGNSRHWQEPTCEIGQSVFLRRHYPDQVRGYILRSAGGGPPPTDLSDVIENRLPVQGEGEETDRRLLEITYHRFPPPALPGSGSGVCSQALGATPNGYLLHPDIIYDTRKKARENIE